MAFLPPFAADIAGCETHPMLIQCQTCATRYRVDPERLPRRKTFVRCKSCGTPIYLDPTLEGGDAPEPAAGGPLPSGPIVTDSAALPEAPAGASAGGLATHGPPAAATYAPDAEPLSGTAPAPHDGVPVQCPQCGSRYRVPAGPLRRPNVKLKCSVCGHIFAPAGTPAAVSEERMDSLFDDLRPGPGPSAAGARLTDSAVERLHAAPAGAPFSPQQSSPPAAELDPELAYLDAVALGDEEAPAARKVPEDQKYRMFLQPDRFGARREAPASPAAPAAPPEPPLTPPERHVGGASRQALGGVPGASRQALGGAPAAPPESARAFWPERGGEDLLEIEFFDDEEAPPRAAPHAAPTTAATAAAPGPPAPAHRFDRAETVQPMAEAEVREPSPEAPVAEELAWPPLDVGLEEKPSAEPMPGDEPPTLMDLEALALPPESPAQEARRELPPDLSAGSSRQRPERSEIGLDREPGRVQPPPRPRVRAQPGRAAAGVGEADVSRLESDLESADLPPLDDVDLDALEFDAAQAAREASEGTFDFGLPSQEPPVESIPLGAPDELPPLTDLEPLPEPSPLGAPDELPPVGDLEPLPGPSPLGAPEELTPLPDLDAFSEPSPLGAPEELPPLPDLDSLSGPSPLGVPEELPPLPDLEPLSGLSSAGASEELPPLPDLEPLPQFEPAAATEPAPERIAPRGQASAEALPLSIVPEPSEPRRAPPGKEPPVRHVVPGQQGWFTDRRRVLASFAAAGVLVGAILGWAGWLMRGNTERPFALEFGRVPPLALQEDLTGRVVTNRSGQKLFAVEGSLVNRFPAGTHISWVRVRGTVYADRTQNQFLGSAQAYLGNVLTQEQLQTWAPGAIAAYGAYTNGRQNVNFEIPPGGAVPFQLVFPDIRAPVARTVAQVTSYTRNGLTVYLDAPVKGGQ